MAISTECKQIHAGGVSTLLRDSFACFSPVSTTYASTGVTLLVTWYKMRWFILFTLNVIAFIPT